jgi:diguanylate cyclase (GGDEF)-like protein
VTLATAGGILLLERYLIRVPNPGAMTFLVVAFAAYLGGLASGLVSAGISLAFAAVYFSEPGELLRFTPDNLARMLVLAICTPAMAIMMGILHARARTALVRERGRSKELNALRSAMDQSDIGMVLLDADLRAQFINRAYRRLWNLPDDIADSKPGFDGLLHHARDAKAFAVNRHEMDAYVAERTALVRAGNERPLDIRLANGDVIRFRCKALSEGGRMLSYGNVSDIVRNADEVAQLATVDHLTGIYNRRYFLNRLGDEWDRYRRYGRPLSLLVIDIDMFKSVNDRFGHDVGDQVIVYVAGICGDRKRNSDILSRIGGEEFALLLPETDIKEARRVAERLRNAVAQLPVPHDDAGIAVTVSIGAATADANMRCPQDLMKRADEALYSAKRNGRNRVVSQPRRMTRDIAEKPVSAV